MWHVDILTVASYDPWIIFKRSLFFKYLSFSCDIITLFFESQISGPNIIKVINPNISCLCLQLHQQTVTSQSAGNTPDEAAAQTDASQDAEMSQQGHRTENKLFPMNSSDNSWVLLLNVFVRTSETEAEQKTDTTSDFYKICICKKNKNKKVKFAKWSLCFYNTIQWSLQKQEGAGTLAGIWRLTQTRQQNELLHEEARQWRH